MFVGQLAVQVCVGAGVEPPTSAVKLSTVVSRLVVVVVLGGELHSVDIRPGTRTGTVERIADNGGRGRNVDGVVVAWRIDNNTWVLSREPSSQQEREESWLVVMVLINVFY